ncbi:SEN1 N terminal-domain-containing protein [Neohortaea acidophila]|uniref:SEN1 N terminal-domain-containing protein n=1 Tax=Neohortaea acidophila TaxID=245834 RepID=A0A6A6PHX1_9PEZI|nr:SEN1 N terminal-domain-containing protein [Neohortaea acidophila]KAF2479592.1 SEN1 N terminal-domain-containing protein [Neohortaea acidophila]
MGHAIVQSLNELTQLDPGLHWFCPRSAAADSRGFFDEDVLADLPKESDHDKAARLREIDNANQRRDVALDVCKIFAYDGVDALPFQDQLRLALKAQLTRCDVCVREYHRSRSLLMQRLESQFDIEEVRHFMDQFDAMNITRISNGLKTMEEALLTLPPDKRSIAATGDAGMYALFEAFHCIPFLKDEETLQKSLDRPLDLLQTKKKVKLPSYAPGMAAFIFSHNQERRSWAMKNFSGIRRPLTSTEFEYSVKPFLEAGLARVNILAMQRDFLPTFWRGTREIVLKLTTDLIATHLRAMDSNLYTVGLEHFQIDDAHFTDLLATYQLLVEQSPTDFWDAMAPISAQSVVETIFRSPALQKTLKITQETQPLQLGEKMEWTVQITKSLKPVNVVAPVKVILDQLLHAIQKDPYSRYARSVCWQKGLTCLLTALRTMREHVKSGPTIRHMVQIVAKDHIPLVMSELDGIEKKTEMQIDKTEQMCLDIVEYTLALDVAGLAQDRYTIVKTKALDHELNISGLEMWKMSMRHVRPGHPSLAASILYGIRDLLLLETFPPRHISATLKQAELWNLALGRVQTYVCNDLLERLDAFGAEQLDELFMLPSAANGLIHLLFSGEASVHQSALNVLKVLSGQDERRGSIMHIISAFPTTSVPSINEALARIARHRVFAPCSVTLKLCTDVLSSLCDSQDGILRSKKISEDSMKGIELFWERIWLVLGMIFEQTEPWSNHGYDKQMLQDFCRETMAFADYAFDQYSIIATTLQGSAKAAKGQVRKMLLEFPKSRFSQITKWLRLRDEYLINKAVTLTTKILGRLQEVGIQIDDGAAQYLQNVVTSTDKNAVVRTKLSPQQKAELQRALENHTGESIAEVVEISSADVRKKQSSLEGWTSSARGSGASTPVSDAGRASKPGTIDVDAWSEAAKRRKEAQAKEEAEMKKIMNTIPGSEAQRKKLLLQQKKPTSTPAIVKSAQKNQEAANDFLLKRQREKEEAAKRKAAAVAKANGVVGVGSGVTGLGDIGKDHSMKGQNVMVSSDEESEEDEEDELDVELFGLGPGKKKTARPNVDPNGALGLKAEQKNAPTRIHRTQRSLKDQRARLAPDLTPLHRIILGWDFFHEGDYPPGSKEHQFRGVSNSFTDPITYRDTFQPLLTLEAWQGMVKAREETVAKPYEVKIQNRTNVDSFIELSSLIGHQENREVQIQEGDIILLSKVKNAVADSTAPHCLARVYRVKRQKAFLEIVYQVVSGSSLAPSLLQQATVWGVKIQTIVPLEREYGALQALQYYDLCNQIVQAKPSKRITFSERQIAAYQDVWNVNRAQSEAINAALTNEGFSLIQGPPGSGKTKTIVAIVGGLLTQALSASNTGTKIAMPKVNGDANSGADAPPRKLLVCAPSNAAVDELVMRLKEGVKTKSGRHHKLNVVRIGRSEAINQQVLDVTMDELVAQRMGTADNDQKMREKNAELFKEHEKVSTELRELSAKRDSGSIIGKALSDMESDLLALRKRKRDLGVRIDNAKDAERNANRQAELNRKRAQQAVLDDAHVICATLSGSGHDMFQSMNIDLETVIIDEAAQCVEMSSLIPLKYGCVKCILVGDPKQLPPTVFSKEAAKFQYEQSLFVRMQNNFANEVHLLDTQYRMHPQISLFPSKTFYDALLKDGPGMAGLRERPWHKSALLAPYKFYDVAGQHQAAPKGHSLVNLAEIDIAMLLYQRLISDQPNYDFTSKIGIITPYKSQLNALKTKFPARFGDSVFQNVEFNTTDAFQGRESEIIIFSCVRASPAGGIGFLQDVRRMNVGLTRAKSSLWVLGNSESLVRGQFWRKLVEDAKARDCYTSGDLKGMLSQASSHFPAPAITTAAMLDGSSEVQTIDRTSGINPTRNGAGSAPAEPRLPISAVQDSRADRMEGIRYRAEDRLQSKKPTASTNESRSAQPLKEPIDKSIDQEDIEMRNADDEAAMSNRSSVSRSATPLSAAEEKKRPAGGAGTARPGSVAPAPVAQHLKKRPAPSPFMPRKQAKPKQ